ncbi:heterokaryon incompatibility protein (het-6OR allele) [Fusarium globosum]|uniref:Heterokaryon incompatibility protein (Het-6OR allele) n=1 Tax=Fusarium globosum TaxID=78864 RepID=A0A8H5XJT2_9HYPO|nr:heterokaryon incompatibility protein (het-6OR allele) [Fusarium globosum]
MSPVSEPQPVAQPAGNNQQGYAPESKEMVQPRAHQPMDPQKPQDNVDRAEPELNLRGGKDCDGHCRGRFCFIIPCSGDHSIPGYYLTYSPSPLMGPLLQYQPLIGDEIRLLKIEILDGVEAATNDGKRPLIACSLEHVCLPPASKGALSQKFKGNDRKWPELSEGHDTAALFKNGRDPHPDKGNSNEQRIPGDTDLPWRHEWGDYIALSYVWGHPKLSDEEAPYSITVDGRPFEVTPNLFHALVQLSQSYRIRQGFKLWIDAICINQNDNDERGKQVVRMRDIYQSAWQVAIWLGPADQDSQLALSALDWLARESKRPNPMVDFYTESFSIDLRPIIIMWPTYESPMKKEVYKALFYFFTRPYWRRMWVLQEVAMGNLNTPVICGDKCISWNDIHRAVNLIAGDESRFGHAILESVRPLILTTWSFEFARDRLIKERDWAPERMWKVQQTMMRIQEHQKVEAPSIAWQELVRALNLARDSLVTEEKDRVYGILGIKVIADRVKIKPDYNLSKSAIFANFASELMAKGDLNILRLVSGPGGHIPTNWTVDKLPAFLRNQSMAPFLLAILNSVTKGQGATPVGAMCNQDIPSWAVCWTCTPAPTAQLGGAYQADAGLGRSVPIFSTACASLTTKGVILDTIISLSACNAAEVNTRYPLNSSYSRSIYGDLEATRSAFWRTIVADTTSQAEEKAPEYYAWLLDPKLWQRGLAGIYTHGFGLYIFMKRNRHLELCGYTLEEIIFRPREWFTRVKEGLVGESLYNPTEMQRESLSWAINAMAWRRLLGTKNGRMGLGTCAAEVNDKIALLRGCNTPVILREYNGGWKLIGECYTHGVMYGEVTAKEDELVDITIY